VRDKLEGPFNGWSVIEADDADAALQILKDHPFIGRGGQLQVSQPSGIPAGRLGNSSSSPGFKEPTARAR
jgi:hypothetical protein